jgi:hypothetical protein
LYNNAKGYYGDLINQGQTAVGNTIGNTVGPVYNAADSYYQQLIDMLSQPQPGQ